MTSVDLAAIRDTVRLRGDYPVSATFTDVYVNGEIQAAWSELYELIEKQNEGWWDKDSTIVTVASQAYVGLPTDCWKVKGIDRADGSEWKRLDQVGIAQRNKFGASQGRPSHYRLSARGLELYRTPDAVYTLRVTYAPIRPDLADAVNLQYFNDWQEYVIVSTLLRLDQREQRDVGDRLNELGRVTGRIVEAVNGRRQAEPEYLTLHDRDDHCDWGD